jgi:hypothetical protein
MRQFVPHYYSRTLSHCKTSGFRPGAAELRNNRFVCMLSHRARYIIWFELRDWSTWCLLDVYRSSHFFVCPCITMTTLGPAEYTLRLAIYRCVLIDPQCHIYRLSQTICCELSVTAESWRCRQCWVLESVNFLLADSCVGGYAAGVMRC